MNKSPSEVEIVAERVHDVWGDWMKYMFGFNTYNEDGSFTIPAEQVRRWGRQMNTPYALLPKAETKSDIEIAERYIRLLK